MSSPDFRVRIHTGPVPLKRVPNANMRDLVLPAKHACQAGEIVWKLLSVRTECDELAIFSAQPAVIHEHESDRDPFVLERADAIKDLLFRHIVSVSVPGAPAEPFEDLRISFLPA